MRLKSLSVAAFANAAAVIIRLLLTLILNKLLAVYLGPSGFASFYQFTNVLNLTAAVSGGFLGQATSKVLSINEQRGLFPACIEIFKIWFYLAVPVSMTIALIAVLIPKAAGLVGLFSGPLASFFLYS